MKRKGWHLQESPPYAKSKVIKKNTDKESDSDTDEEDTISLSDIWCTFDQPFKVICHYKPACSFGPIRSLTATKQRLQYHQHQQHQQHQQLKPPKTKYGNIGIEITFPK